MKNDKELPWRFYFAKWTVPIIASPAGLLLRIQMPENRKQFLQSRRIFLFSFAAASLLPSRAMATERKKFIQTLIHAARLRTQKFELYDPAYRQIAYPMGDVPEGRGVCTDVVIRAYRAAGVDLQVLVHQDMSKNFALYPKIWGMRGTDRNIDHRRVPNLQTFFRRKGAQLPLKKGPEHYQAGDMVTWMLPGNRPHIGIVSDRFASDQKTPLILHNIGLGSVEDDIIFRYDITGHYRYHPIH